MAEQIEMQVLVDAVADLLRGLPLEGQTAFHARVAAGALGIVSRELAQEPRAAETAALAGFLGRDAPLETMRAELCGRLRMRQLTPETPGLLEALTQATLARLRVDNPRYATLGRLAGA
jgi:hypothetical protein